MPENDNATYNTTFQLIESFTEDNNRYDEQETLGRVLKVKPLMDILLMGSLLLIMICMGFEIKKEELLHHIKKPIGVGIGMISQFVVMPLSAFVLLRCVSVSGIQATGVLLLSCCPGGALSNVIAYLCEGDLSLSVVMTSFSTIAAMGLMPLNLWMYGRTFDTEGLTVPYAKLAVSVVCITSPVALGMILRWKTSRIVSLSMKVASVFAFLFTTVYVIYEVVVFPTMIERISGKLYAIMVSLPFIGCILSYVLTLVFRQNTAVRKTIVIECGVQNVPTALAIIFLSFPLEHHRDLIPLPYLYSFIVIIGGFGFCCLYQVHKRCCSQKMASKELNTTKPREETEEKMCQDISRDEQKLKQLQPRIVKADLDVPESKTHL